MLSRERSHEKIQKIAAAAAAEEEIKKKTAEIKIDNTEKKSEWKRYLNNDLNIAVVHVCASETDLFSMKSVCVPHVRTASVHQHHCNLQMQLQLHCSHYVQCIYWNVRNHLACLLKLNNTQFVFPFGWYNSKFSQVA